MRSDPPSKPSVSGASISPSDRGLLLSDGVFDTAMVLDGRIVFEAEHHRRLWGSAALIGADHAKEAVLEAQSAALSGVKRGILRTTVTSGSGGRGLQRPSPASPTVLCQVTPLDLTYCFRPVRACPTEIRRNETSPTSRHKTLAYFDAVQARQAAEERGAEEALFSNSAGRPVCFAAANLFIITGQTLITPPVEEGALPGIVRDWMLANAHRVGLEAHEAPIASLQSVQEADVLLATNSLRLISPVTLIPDDKSIPQMRVLDDLIDLLVLDLSAQGFDLPIGETSLAR